MRKLWFVFLLATASVAAAPVPAWVIPTVGDPESCGPMPTGKCASGDVPCAQQKLEQTLRVHECRMRALHPKPEPASVGR